MATQCGCATGLYGIHSTEMAKGHLTTTKPDKYDRYLVDIFYGNRTEPTETVLRKGIFLNQILLKSGRAKRSH